MPAPPQSWRWSTVSAATSTSTSTGKYKETQVRVEFIDPFFEALGRDVRKFFLEARKPSVALRADIGPAYQLRRYAWSAELPLSILTDFEEFAVYDCRIKPKPEDKALYQRQIEMTDRQIDALVHELYGLTEEEIGIVEGGV